MHFFRTLTAWLLALCCVQLLPASATAQNDKTRQLELTLGADVLVYTEPLRKDGSIDYVAAFNKHSSQGVTHDNNVFRGLFLLFDQSVREDDWFDDKAHRAAMIEALEVAQAELASGPKVVSWYTYAEQQGLSGDTAGDLEEAYWDGPYDAEETAPYVAWLKHIEPALIKAMQVLDRPKYYWPRISTDEAQTLINVLMPHLGDHRSLARGLQAWAFYQALNGEPQQALHAMRAVRELALHTSSDGVIISVLVGISLDALAFHTTKTLIERKALPAESLVAFEAMLAQRAPLHTTAKALAGSEKALVLEQYMRVVIDAAAEAAGADPVAQIILAGAIDVNHGLKDIAAYYDGLNKAISTGSFKQRQEALGSYHRRFMINNYERDLFVRVDGQRVPNVEQMVTQAGRTDLLTVLLLDTLAPSVDRAVSVELGIIAKERAMRVALAVERYRLKHDRLPENLTTLLPDFLDAVPADPFNGEPMRYKRLEKGFVVYSVGENLKDDGGLDEYRDGDRVIEVIYGRTH